MTLEPGQFRKFKGGGGGSRGATEKFIPHKRGLKSIRSDSTFVEGFNEDVHEAMRGRLLRKEFVQFAG
jgi:hypothetical protein